MKKTRCRTDVSTLFHVQFWNKPFYTLLIPTVCISQLQIEACLCIKITISENLLFGHCPELNWSQH